MRIRILAVLLVLGACASEPPTPEVASSELTVAAIPRGSSWRFWDGGGDLGTSWRGSFDDASWGSGAGPLGFGESYVTTTVTRGPITHYFRRTFTVGDPAAVTAMAGEVMYDDGFVVYLNGVEIGREAMPSGTITAATPSSGHEANNAYVRYDWASHIDRLVAGTNTIAVEVHQAGASSSDLVFDLALALETSSAPPPAGEDVWFYWDNGGDLGTAWRTLQGPAAGWDSGAGPLGYGESYIRTPIARNGVTAYFRRTFTVDDDEPIWNILGQVMYDDGFVAYLNGTEIQRGSMPSGPITAATLATGHEANNEHLSYDWSGYEHLLVPGANVLAIEVHQSSASSSDLVFDARITLQACCGDPTPPPVIDSIPRESGWFYWDEGGDLGTAWRTLPSVASGWDIGHGQMGYGEPYVETELESGHVTTYYRRAFEVDDPAAVTSLVGSVMYDDGFVAYLNGVEIQRAAMPSGTVTAATLSTGHEANNAYVTFDWTAHRHRLVAGVNVLAFEVHQASAGSSDLVFDAGLEVEADAPPPPAGGVVIAEIRRTDFWLFWDYGGVPDDPSWKTADWPTQPWEGGHGPFGYGESYIITPVEYGTSSANKHVTTYFWNRISTHNPGAVTNIVVDVMYDDGFVLYLNGTEVARRSMPAGAIGSSTLALGHEAGNAYETIDLSAYRHLLRMDDNVVAVEVHQAEPSSSDLVFDLSMKLLGQAAPPPAAGEDTPRRSTWRYWDGPDSPSGSIDFWNNADFNDAQWETGAGPLGYGESYVATTIDAGGPVAYFRRSFTVDDPWVQTSMIAEVMYDDGLVVYLNGAEIVRRNVPATAREANNTYETIDLSEHSSHLVDGTNVLAVELHTQDSDDLVFDLALRIDTPSVCAVPGGGPGTPPEAEVSLTDVWVGPSTAITVGTDGTVGRRGADGAWCWAELEDGVAWRGVWGTADDAVWIVGDGGRVRRFDGASFTPVDVGTSAALIAIHGTGPDDIWITGAGGTVRHFDGTAWRVHDLAADKTMMSVWAAAPGVVWISGNEPAPYPGNSNYDGSSGLIYRLDPATGGWTLEVKTTRYYGGASYSSLHGTGADDVWAIGRDHPAGAACSISTMRRWDGATWSPMAGAPTECRSWNDVAAGAPGATDGAWIVGTSEDDTGAWRYTGGAWDDSDAPNGLTAIDHRGDRMFAVGRSWGAAQLVLRWNGAGFVSDW